MSWKGTTYISEVLCVGQICNRLLIYQPDGVSKDSLTDDPTKENIAIGENGSNYVKVDLNDSQVLY